MADFDKNNGTGKLGENLILKFLNKHADTDKVIDVRKVLEYRTEGGDFLWHKKDRKVFSVEVKTTKKEEPEQYMDLETVSNDQTNSQGWFLRCRAGLLIWVFWATQEICIMDLKRMQEHFIPILHQYEMGTWKTWDKNTGEVWYRSHYRKVPLQDVLSALGPYARLLKL